VDVPIRYASFDLGSMTVGLRRDRRLLDPGDEQLLTALATQCGPSLQVVQLVRDLRRGRDRLVDERDAERARIRRDLHDGLGPVLAGVALGIEAAARAPTRSADLLTRLSDDVHAGLADVRRLVDDLRPPELDGGLVPALHRYAAEVTVRSGGALIVQIDAHTCSMRLPERVEVAGYRIALEAATNVVRHADATTCRIRVEADHEAMRLEVRDNGHGMPANAAAGIGIESMRRRAGELGGTCTVSSRANGTMVAAILPLDHTTEGLR
jgi:signal transduction histidine kinase